MRHSHGIRKPTDCTSNCPGSARMSPRGRSGLWNQKVLRTAAETRCLLLLNVTALPRRRIAPPRAPIAHRRRTKSGYSQGRKRAGISFSNRFPPSIHAHSAILCAAWIRDRSPRAEWRQTAENRSLRTTKNCSALRITLLKICERSELAVLPIHLSLIFRASKNWFSR